MKILHAADLHIDSPLRGLATYEGAPVEAVRGASRRAFEALVDGCVTERVALLLLAGDLFDGDWRDYSTGLFFERQMARLAEVSTRVIIVRGNHDAQSIVTRHLRGAEHVYQLSADAPETVHLEELGIAVHGQSFATRHVTEDLASRYPAPRSDALNIGLLHTSLDGRPRHDPYAPTSAAILRSRGYQYWALGHVHAREVVSADPWIVFPGNLQGRHYRETGPKGATMITVDDTRIVDVSARVFDCARWEVCTVDARELTSPNEVLDRARELLEVEVERAEGRLLCARVSIDGPSAAREALGRDPERWQAEMRAIALRLGVFLEQVVFETDSTTNVPRLARDDGALDVLLRGLDGSGADEELWSELGREVAELVRRLPPEFRGVDDALDLTRAETRARLTAEVARELTSRLTEREDS